MNKATYINDIPNWLNNKFYFVKNDIYEYKIENNQYLVYFHTGQSDWLNIPCHFTKKQFDLYFTSINELRKQKLQKLCFLKD